jgi:hypothetical protein
MGSLRAPELFVPFRHPAGRAPPVSEIRSTLVVSSLQSLRTHGLLERYESELAEKDREDLFALIAGTWIPVELGDRRYRAGHRVSA